jgi:hypothetical protein
MITQGRGEILSVFVADDGVFLFSPDEATLVDRTGRVLARRALDSGLAPINAFWYALFDGHELVAVHAGGFRRYDSLLRAQNFGSFTRVCGSAALFDEFLVCSPDSSSTGAFITYELSTGRAAYTSEYKDEATLHRIPGRNELLAWWGAASTDWRVTLYVVTEAGQIEARTGSPSELDVRPPMAFLGSPATHVVFSNGPRFCVDAEQCPIADGSPLAEEGRLGTLDGPPRIRALEADPTGKLRALVERGETSEYGWPCRGGCSVQGIDATSGAVQAETELLIGSAQVRHFAVDPRGGVVVVCSSVGGSGGFRILHVGDATQ